MVNAADYIDLGSLTMDELAGVVHLYPWFASARKELCARMSRSGGDDWGTEQYAQEALYIGDRRKVADLLRAGRKADYADKDAGALIRSYIGPSPEAEAEEEREERMREAEAAMDEARQKHDSAEKLMRRAQEIIADHAREAQQDAPTVEHAPVAGRKKSVLPWKGGKA